MPNNDDEQPETPSNKWFTDRIPLKNLAGRISQFIEKVGNVSDIQAVVKTYPYTVKALNFALDHAGFPLRIEQILKLRQAKSAKEALFILTDCENERDAIVKLGLYATGMTPMKQKLLFIIFDRYVSPELQAKIPAVKAFFYDNFNHSKENQE